MSPARAVWLRDWLIRFLFASTALQSFDGLVQRAARYQQFGTSGWAADWLPKLWAATIDAIWYAGLLGVQRHGGRDWLSWLAFLAAFGASVGFQVIGATDVPVAAVPPVALLLVLVVMHAPRRAAADAEPAPPVPAQAASGTATAADAPLAAGGGWVPAGSPAGTAGPADRALPPGPAVRAEARPAQRERPGAGTAAGSNPGKATADSDQAMRAHWAAERARGRTPSGAELDRVVGRNPDNGAGRKARARYLREEAEGQLTALTGSVPGPAPAAAPARPLPAGTAAAREPTGNAAASLPSTTARAWTADPAALPAGNGHPARPVVPAALEAFPARHDDGETTDA